MICQNCQKQEVTVHFTEIIDGKVIELHLCEDCARQKGIALTPADAVSELISTLAAGRETDADEDVRCPCCGLTLKELRSGGRLGCGECYRTFSASLKPLMKNLHKGTSHTGKLPAAARKNAAGPKKRGRAAAPGKPSSGASGGGERKRGEDALRLQEEIRAAVADEDYEKAAQLRDRMKESEPPRTDDSKNGVSGSDR
ncbi:MAG: UvrB/UvrC motif-containing protein [PVC group bacterium]